MSKGSDQKPLVVENIDKPSVGGAGIAGIFVFVGIDLFYHD